MPYSDASLFFRKNEHLFFEEFSRVENRNTNTVDERVETINYAYLIQNQNRIETEFNDLFKMLDKNHDNDIFWLYCYYCAAMLNSFYEAYGQKENAKKFEDFKTEIKNFLNTNQFTNQEEPASFSLKLRKSIKTSFNNLVTAPGHISQVRDYVAFANLCRLYWAFCRLTLTQSLNLAKELKLIEKLDALIGTHTDVDKIIAVFKAPIGVINYFSVGFFLTRFIIDAGLLVKHTFFPTKAEKGLIQGCDVNKLDELPDRDTVNGYLKSYIVIGNNPEGMSLYYINYSGDALPLNLINDEAKIALFEQINDKHTIRLNEDFVKDLITDKTTQAHTPEPTSRYERFKFELYKRHCNFMNDVVWSVINLLTNFNQIFGISGPAAGFITAVFLGYDVFQMLYRCNLAKQDYLTKKAQYTEDRQYYVNNINAVEREKHINLLNQQLADLEYKWQTKQAAFYFNAVAASLLMMGFTVSMLVSAPILIASSFFVCTVAVAMYLSGDVYALYKEKSLYLEEAQLCSMRLVQDGNPDKPLVPEKLAEQKYNIALKEFQTARSDFIFTMTKNTVMPMILITTFAICWPAAIVLTVMYLGAELWHGKARHNAKLQIGEIAAQPVGNYLALA